jgi:hypothetical protein
MNEQQRRFWRDLLAYYREELQERQQPAMVSMLGFFHGEEQASQDRRLAEAGYVYLLKASKLRVKRIDDVSPHDAPYLMAELEANQVMAEEHSTVRGDETVTEVPAGGVFSHPHYEDATLLLRRQWHELESTWDAR